MDIKLILLLVTVAVCAGRRSSPYYGRLSRSDPDSAALERRVTRIRSQIDKDILGKDSYEKHYSIPNRLGTLRYVSKLRRRLRGRRRNCPGCRIRYRGPQRLRRYRSRTGRKSHRYPRNIDQVDYYDRPYYGGSLPRSSGSGSSLPLLGPLQELFQNVLSQTMSPVWYVYRRLPLFPPQPVKPVYNRRDSVEDRRRGRPDERGGRSDQSEGQSDEWDESIEEYPGRSDENGQRSDRRKGGSGVGRERSRELEISEDRPLRGSQKGGGRKRGSGVGRDRSRELEASEDLSLSGPQKGGGRKGGSGGGRERSRELETSEDRSLPGPQKGRRRKGGSDVGIERSRELEASEDRSLSGPQKGRGRKGSSGVGGERSRELETSEDRPLRGPQKGGRREGGSGVGRDRSRELEASEDLSLSGPRKGIGKPRVNVGIKEVERLELQGKGDGGSVESGKQKVQKQDRKQDKERIVAPRVPPPKPTRGGRLIVAK